MRLTGSLGMGGAVALMPALALAAPLDDVMTRWRAGRWTIWRIDRPAVDHARTFYPDIRFQPGDRVRVDAGGCARLADGSRVSYLGAEGEAEALVAIPGATTGLVPIRTVLRQSLAVSDLAPPAGSPLRLGFRSPRAALSGEAAACAGAPDAYAWIGVEHALEPPAPMDLVWDGAVDANGIPLNPKWGQQVTEPGSIPDPVEICFSVPGWFDNPVCTVQHPTIDTAARLKAIICGIGTTTPIAGHVNWYPSTYQGPIFWGAKSWSDKDYGLHLVPPDKSGLTTAAPEAIWCEFDARETIDHFVTPWWTAFRDAVAGRDARAREMVDGRPAIVGGLIGLDCEHDCGTELHPVWLLAIRVSQDARSDVWAIFARNWGNEGFCSRFQHHLDLSDNQYTLTLPWREGATGVRLGAGTRFHASHRSIRTSWGAVPGEKVNLTFQLPAPDVRGRIHGELHLRWTGGGVVAPDDEAAAAAGRPEGAVRGGQAEALVTALARDLSPEQRAELERRVAVPLGPKDTVPVRLRRQRDSDVPVIPSPSPGVRAVVDPGKEEADDRMLRALQDAYGGRLPGIIGDAIRER